MLLIIVSLFCLAGWVVARRESKKVKLLSERLTNSNNVIGQLRSVERELPIDVSNYKTYFTLLKELEERDDIKTIVLVFDGTTCRYMTSRWLSKYVEEKIYNKNFVEDRWRDLCSFEDLKEQCRNKLKRKEKDLERQLNTVKEGLSQFEDPDPLVEKFKLLESKVITPNLLPGETIGSDENSVFIVPPPKPPALSQERLADIKARDDAYKQLVNYGIVRVVLTDK
jgi:hypothetical protein